jgi:spore maturation protein CgeB
MDRYVWREFHSYAASHGISVTWDWCPEVELSYSARIYRVMASRGLYLCKYVKGMENVFKRGVHCDWYDTLDEMSEKIAHYLNNPRIMQTIGKQAQEEVYKNHTFDKRIEVIDTWLKNNL